LAIIRALGRLGALASAAIAAQISWHAKPPIGIAFLLPKDVAGSVSAFAAAAGAGSALLALTRRSRLAALAGLTGWAVSANYVCSVTGPAKGFEDSFGSGWEERIPPHKRASLPPTRWTWRLKDSPQPVFRPDVPYSSLPGSGRQLLCDIWEPAASVRHTGLGYVYVHGGAWHYLEKGIGTQTLFRHLAGQGHVVMDISYRLAPETDVFGMTQDVKRAIAWIKANSTSLELNKDTIVVGGSSAGAHLALLCAYTGHVDRLTPDDLTHADLSVKGVVSYYGPTDLGRFAFHNQRESGSDEEKTGRLGTAVWNLFWQLAARDTGTKAYSPEELAANLLGEETAERAANATLASPLAHVNSSCPPTLIFHGVHDSLVPLSDSRRLFRSLRDAGVPAVYHEFPQTEHAFDFFLPRLSPAAQSALYDLDRFLALLLP
jgi:acetyl esterase/lipase